MTTRGGVQQVGLQHGVVVRAAHGHAVMGEHVDVVFQVLTDLGWRLALQHRAQRVEHMLAIKLIWRAHVVVRHRHVPGLAGLHGKGQADQAASDGIQRIGFRIQADQFGGFQALDECVQGVLAQHRVVLNLRGCIRCIGCGRRRLVVKIGQPAVKVHALVELTQHVGFLFASRQRVKGQRQLHIATDGREFSRFRQLVEVFAQRFADLAADGVSIGDDAVQITVGVEPFGGGLRANLGHAGDVVGGIAHQRQQIDDAFGADAEFFYHPDGVHALVFHGVVEQDLVADDLRHVLVTGHDDRLPAGGLGLFRQRADHVVGFHAVDLQHWQAQAIDQCADRLELVGELRRYGRAVGLVVGIQRMAEGLAPRVEDHRDVVACFGGQQLAQHVAHAEHGAGGLAAGIGQRRQGVKRPVKPAGAVEQVKRVVGAHVGSTCSPRQRSVSVSRARTRCVVSPSTMISATRGLEL